MMVFTRRFSAYQVEHFAAARLAPTLLVEVEVGSQSQSWGRSLRKDANRFRRHP
jgi:hypothetical protein